MSFCTMMIYLYVTLSVNSKVHGCVICEMPELTYKAPPIFFSRRQFQVLLFSLSPKIANKAWFNENRLQTISMKCHTSNFFFQKLRRCRKMCRLLQSRLVL